MSAAILDTTPATMGADITALRERLTAGKVTIAQIAAALNVTERAIYKAIERHHIPFVKILGVRYLDPDVTRRALAQEANTAARGPGRPRKHAA